ncbi:hypothetical protein KIN20_026108 [Parelaphostrongylus tenuis]|uniref:Uncharacterized protein n=1 Tax=Parelaphostrongylus tenuis TaxID=148309 RepID=A0AAD5QUV6_PARTN|nr:hypothetical protein KIN20_026108 [Parelaphostrongylus tenuis]
MTLTAYEPKCGTREAEIGYSWIDCIPCHQRAYCQPISFGSIVALPFVPGETLILKREADEDAVCSGTASNKAHLLATVPRKGRYFSEQLRAIVEDTMARNIAAGPNEWSRRPLLRSGGQYRVVLAS